MQVPQLTQVRFDRSLGQDPLQPVVHLGRNKVDRGVLEHILLVVENDHRQTFANLGHAFRWNVDVGFQVAVFIDRGEHGGGRDVVAQVHGNVADDAVKGSRDVVIAKLLSLALRRRDR